MSEGNEPTPEKVAFLERALDTRAIEVLALTVVRALFRDGVRIPIKVTGLSDMEVVVRDADVTVNLNQLQMQVPPLAIWRVTVAYQGRPLVEYGRGIKNDMKVHLGQLFFLLMVIWREKRKNRKALASAEAARIAATPLPTIGGP